MKFNLWLLWMFCGGAVFERLFKMKHKNTIPIAPANEGKPVFDQGELAASIVAQIVIALLFWAITGHIWAYIPLWGMPRFSVMTGLNAVRASIEHADLDKPPHRLKSFSSNLIESFFLSPFNMNYHGEHHAYMTVQTQYLPGLRKMFLDSEHARDFEIVPSYWHEYKRILSCMTSQTT